MELQLPLQRTAVVVVECQNDLIHASRIGSAGIGAALAEAVKRRDVLRCIATVLNAARAAGVPVVYANKESKPGVPPPDAPIFRIGNRHPILIEGTEGASVHPEIAPQPGDLVLRRFLAVDASGDSSLFATLRALGRSIIVAMGVSTNFAVEGTVRGAVNQGFAVVVPEDCCASVPDEMHEFSVERILPLLGTVTTSDRVAAAFRSAQGQP